MKLSPADKIAILEMWKERISVLIAKHSDRPQSDNTILADLCELAALNINLHSNSKKDPTPGIIEKCR